MGVFGNVRLIIVDKIEMPYMQVNCECHYDKQDWNERIRAYRYEASSVVLMVHAACFSKIRPGE
jgi:hypothetical protein